MTLITGRQYQFTEGKLTGRGQKVFSHYTYLQALTTGQTSWQSSQYQQDTTFRQAHAPSMDQTNGPTTTK